MCISKKLAPPHMIKHTQFLLDGSSMFASSFLQAVKCSELAAAKNQDSVHTDSSLAWQKAADLS